MSNALEVPLPAPPRTRSWLGQLLAGLAAFWHEGRTVERIAYTAGAIMIVSGLCHIAVYAVDGGPWEGPVSWRKPITFGLSFGLTLISAAWAMSFLRLWGLARNLLLGLFIGACTVEVVSITLQRWRGVASHFNEETTFDEMLGKFGIAAGGGVLFTFVLVVTLTTLFRAPFAGMAPELRLGLRAGWWTLLAAMCFGVVMVATAISKTSAPGDGPEQQQAAYTSAGWLKPGHAITMHAIMILPGLAWLTSYLPWSPRRRHRVVALATAGYLVFAAVIAGETLAGLSPLAAPLWASAIALVGLATFAAAVLPVLTALPKLARR